MTAKKVVLILSIIIPVCVFSESSWETSLNSKNQNGVDKLNIADNQPNCVDNSLSPEESEKGWKLLWDGKTTEGWSGLNLSTFPKNGWAIENGMLHLLATIETSGAENISGGNIVSVQKFKNFELAIDFKLTPGGTSGIWYLVNNKAGNQEFNGCKFQLTDDDMLKSSNVGLNSKRTTASLFELIAASAEKSFKKNDFNTVRILVVNNKVTHYLNHKKMLEYEISNYFDFDNSGGGFILLEDGGSEIFFKNIKIREL
jgi:hypothetical protein